jgi:multiple sugar transport system permease protein
LIRAVAGEASCFDRHSLLIWTLLPIYHLFLFSISPKESAFSGKLWPDHPTLHNFVVVFKQEHYYLQHFGCSSGTRY